MPIEFGVNAFMWTDHWGGDSLKLIERAKDIGFDRIEVPLLKTDISLARKAHKRLKSLNMFCVGSASLSDKTDITSSDKSVSTAGINFLKEAVEDTAEMGGRILTGVIYAAFGKKPERPATEDEWKHSAESLAEVADSAVRHNITLAIEPLNRYEMNLVNTTAQAMKLQQMIGKSNIGIHPDTYHMNIEEKDFYSAIKALKGRIVYLHASENDRGIPGTGLVDWDSVFKALAEIGYKGAVTIESFASVIPEIASATCMWRKLAPDGDTLAKEGLKFLKAKAEEWKL